MSEEKGIMPYRGNQIITTFDDASRAANAMAKSGYFQDSREAAQALVKILAGQEMGFGPFAAMAGIHIIQGRPSIGANLMAAAVKGSGRYNYRVVEMTDTVCAIKFFEGKEEIGISRFTIEDARKAGTKNLDRFPRNMLFARAISNGVRWYCPDVFNGSTVYTPEELGAEVDQDGNILNLRTVEPPQAQAIVQELGFPPDPEWRDEVPTVEHPAPEPTAPKANGKASTATLPKMNRETAEAITNSEGTRYGDLDSETLSNMTIGIGKALKKSGLAQSEKDTYQMKLDAIAAILYYRNQDPA